MTVKITQSTFSSILVWDHQTICPNYVFYLTKHHNIGLTSQVWDSEGMHYILLFSVWQGSQPWWWWDGDSQWALPQEVRNLCSAPVLLQLDLLVLLQTAGATGQDSRVIFTSIEGLRQCTQRHKCEKFLFVLGTTDFLGFSEISMSQTLGRFYPEL